VNNSKTKPNFDQDSDLVRANAYIPINGIHNLSRCMRRKPERASEAAACPDASPWQHAPPVGTGLWPQACSGADGERR